MPYTDVQICNLGLAKLSSSRIHVIAPPKTPLEVHCAEGYMHWKETELAKHRWVFAIENDHELTQESTVDDEYRPYKYALPTNCLRPIRQKQTEWKQYGRFLYSAYDKLRIQYVKNVAESEFDPLFVDALAWRVAAECVEKVTQSNTKKADIQAGYRDAVNAAKRGNAFVVGAEDVFGDDADFPFINARFV